MRVIAIYAAQLKSRGHEVSVVSAGLARPSLRERVRSWVRRTELPGKCLCFPSYFDNIDIDHKVLDRWRPIVDADVPDGDVVIATWWETAYWVNNLTPSKGAKAYFMQDYGGPGHDLSQIVPTWRLPLHKITISRWLVELIQEYVEGEQVSLVPNAVDHSMFYAPPRNRQPIPTVGFAYQPGHTKGADLVFDAVKLVRQSLSSLRLIAYGFKQPLEDIPDAIEFHGHPPDAKLRDIYASCDVWLFPSRREGFGLPILEAMACRTPVISTLAGAAPELLECGGGVLISDANGKSMAEAILRFFKLSEIEWKSMSVAAYATAASYTWKDSTDRFEAALQKARW